MLRYRAVLGRSASPVERYSSSLEWDREVAVYAAAVMLAHVEALRRRGCIPAEAAERVSRALRRVVASGGRELYEWVSSSGHVFEDVFEALESYLHEVVGPEAGYVALGRSRNDHVAAVLRLYARDRALRLLELLLKLRRTLLAKAVEYRDVLLPYFTHRRVAQCGSAALFFLSHERSLAVGWRAVVSALEPLNENPLGSGAAAGTLAELDREALSKELCLDLEPLPPYYATGSRTFLLYLVSALEVASSELGRLVEDLLMLSSLDVLELPTEHVATSSIMPHKRNPVTLETAKARLARLAGIAFTMHSLYRSLPYGYNLELQELNFMFSEYTRVLEQTVEVLADLLSGVRVSEGGVRRLLEGKAWWSSELVEYIATSEGVPAREAYLRVARALRESRGDPAKALELLGFTPADAAILVERKPVKRLLNQLVEAARRRVERDESLLESLRSGLEGCAWSPRPHGAGGAGPCRCPSGI